MLIRALSDSFLLLCNQSPKSLPGRIPSPQIGYHYYYRRNLLFCFVKKYLMHYPLSLRFVVASSKVISSNSTGSVRLLSDDLKINATLKNTDWKLLGQVEIPRKTINDVAGNHCNCRRSYVVC